jgi:hypothetical protein
MEKARLRHHECGRKAFASLAAAEKWAAKPLTKNYKMDNNTPKYILKAGCPDSRWVVNAKEPSERRRRAATADFSSRRQDVALEHTPHCDSAGLSFGAPQRYSARPGLVNLQCRHPC